jgi:hypothetical protein
LSDFASKKTKVKDDNTKRSRSFFVKKKEERNTKGRCLKRQTSRNQKHRPKKKRTRQMFVKKHNVGFQNKVHHATKTKKNTKPKDTKLEIRNVQEIFLSLQLLSYLMWETKFSNWDAGFCDGLHVHVHGGVEMNIFL